MDWTGRDLGLAHSTEGALHAHGSKWVINLAMAATLVHALGLDVGEMTDKLHNVHNMTGRDEDAI